MLRMASRVIMAASCISLFIFDLSLRLLSIFVLRASLLGFTESFCTGGQMLRGRLLAWMSHPVTLMKVGTPQRDSEHRTRP